MEVEKVARKERENGDRHSNGDFRAPVFFRRKNRGEKNRGLLLPRYYNFCFVLFCLVQVCYARVEEGLFLGEMKKRSKNALTLCEVEKLIEYGE